MDFDKICSYLIAFATVLNLLSSTAKNIHDMQKDKKRKKRRSPRKGKRR